MIYDLTALKAPRAAGTLLKMIARLAELSDEKRPTEDFFRVDDEGLRSVADQLDNAFLHEATKNR